MHGAAMLQIAEHPEFTAINAFRLEGSRCANAYTVNDNVGVYLKYATKPHGRYHEYIFNFGSDHLAEVNALKTRQERTFITLVCWKDREICCLNYEQFDELISQRRDHRGHVGDSYTVYVRISPRSKFRTYIAVPGKKRLIFEETLVARNAFPDCLFS